MFRFSHCCFASTYVGRLLFLKMFSVSTVFSLNHLYLLKHPYDHEAYDEKNIYRMRLNKLCLVLLLFAASAADDLDFFEGSADFDSCWVRDFHGFQIKNCAR